MFTMYQSQKIIKQNKILQEHNRKLQEVFQNFRSPTYSPSPLSELKQTPHSQRLAWESIVRMHNPFRSLLRLITMNNFLQLFEIIKQQVRHYDFQVCID